jgi:hypothetical protein
MIEFLFSELKIRCRSTHGALASDLVAGLSGREKELTE